MHFFQNLSDIMDRIAKREGNLGYHGMGSLHCVKKKSRVLKSQGCKWGLLPSTKGKEMPHSIHSSFYRYTGANALRDLL